MKHFQVWKVRTASYRSILSKSNDDLMLSFYYTSDTWREIKIQDCVTLWPAMSLGSMGKTWHGGGEPGLDDLLDFPGAYKYLPTLFIYQFSLS